MESYLAVLSIVCIWDEYFKIECVIDSFSGVNLASYHLSVLSIVVIGMNTLVYQLSVLSIVYYGRKTSNYHWSVLSIVRVKRIYDLFT